jgi:hypothetical protein
VNASNDIRKLVNQDVRLHAINDLAAETKASYDPRRTTAARAAVFRHCRPAPNQPGAHSTSPGRLLPSSAGHLAANTTGAPATIPGAPDFFGYTSDNTGCTTNTRDATQGVYTSTTIAAIGGSRTAADPPTT